jgi:hypothetical protein
MPHDGQRSGPYLRCIVLTTRKRKRAMSGTADRQVGHSDRYVLPGHTSPRI